MNTIVKMPQIDVQGLTIKEKELNTNTVKGTWTPAVTSEGYPLVNQVDLGDLGAELLVEGSKVTMVSGEAPSGMGTNADVVFSEKSALYFKVSSKDSVDGFMCSYTGFANASGFDESLTAFLGTGLNWSAEYDGEGGVRPEGVIIDGLGNVVLEGDSYGSDDVIPMSQAEFSEKTWALCFDSSVGAYGELSIYDTETPNTPLASYQLQQDIGNPLCAVLVTPYAWDSADFAPSSVEIIHEPANPIAGFTTLKIGAEAVLSFDDVTANNAYTIVGETGAAFGLHDGDIAFIGTDGASIQQVLKSSKDVDLSAYYTKTQTNSLLAGKASMSDLGSAATQDVEAFATAAQGLLADNALPITTWKEFTMLSPSDDVLQLPKGVYRFYVRQKPLNTPALDGYYEVCTLIVSQDPTVDEYSGKQVGSMHIVGSNEVWEWMMTAYNQVGWVKIYPAVMPDQQQADLAEWDTESPAYVNNVLAARNTISARMYTLHSSELSNIIPEIGGVFVDDSYSTSARTLTWNIASLSTAVNRGYQSLIITKDRSDITLIVNRTDTNAELFNAKLDTNAVYLVGASSIQASGGSSYGIDVEKISNVPKVGKTPYDPLRLTSSNNLNDILEPGWYVFKSNEPPANCFSTLGWTSTAVDILLEVYEGAMLRADAPPYYFPTIVQEVREGAGYFGNIRSTNNPSKTTWKAWTAQDVDGLDDAPSDGKTYARKNGAWVEVVDKPRMPIPLIGDIAVNNADNHSDLFVVPSSQSMPILITLGDPSVSEMFEFKVHNNSTENVTFTDGYNQITDVHGNNSILPDGIVTVTWAGTKWKIHGELEMI